MKEGEDFEVLKKIEEKGCAVQVVNECGQSQCITDKNGPVIRRNNDSFYFVLFTAVNGLFCSVLNIIVQKKDEKNLFSMGLLWR